MYYRFSFLIILFVHIAIGQDNRFGQLNLLKKDTDVKAGETIQAVQSFEETFSLEKVINPDQYILGPGDELGINILMGENFTLPLKVTPTGDVFIPSVGVVKVSGVTLSQGIGIIQNILFYLIYTLA